jgi:hypothetical protein
MTSSQESSGSAANTSVPKPMLTELAVLGAILPAVIMKIAGVPYSGIILTLVLSAAAIIYFLPVFHLWRIRDISLQDMFILRLATIGSSVTAVGIIFKLRDWPNGTIMLTVGLFSIFMGLLYLVLMKSGRPGTIRPYLPVLIRLFVLTAIATALMYLH